MSPVRRHQRYEPHQRLIHILEALPNTLPSTSANSRAHQWLAELEDLHHRIALRFVIRDREPSGEQYPPPAAGQVGRCKVLVMSCGHLGRIISIR